MRLGSGLAAVLSGSVICQHNCPPAEAWPLGAYLLVKVVSPSARSTTLTGQLRGCGPYQYRHRNACQPPGY
jgi:hypothetical protein